MVWNLVNPLKFEEKKNQILIRIKKKKYESNLQSVLKLNQMWIERIFIMIIINFNIIDINISRCCIDFEKTFDFNIFHKISGMLKTIGII